MQFKSLLFIFSQNEYAKLEIMVSSIYLLVLRPFISWSFNFYFEIEQDIFWVPSSSKKTVNRKILTKNTCDFICPNDFSMLTASQKWRVILICHNTSLKYICKKKIQCILL